MKWQCVTWLSRFWLSYGLAFVLSMCLVSQALAQGTGPNEPKPKNFAPCYLIVIFAVVGGVMTICATGKRHADFRRVE